MNAKAENAAPGSGSVDVGQIEGWINEFMRGECDGTYSNDTSRWSLELIPGAIDGDGAPVASFIRRLSAFLVNKEIEAQAAISADHSLSPTSSMAERFVAAYDAWEWDNEAAEDNFADWAHKRGLIGEDRLAFVQNWSLRPDPKTTILDYAVIDFEDGSMAVRRNHVRDGVGGEPWLVLSSSDLSRRLRKSVGTPGAYFGTVEAHAADKLLLESFGVEVGDYDDKARRFFVKADATAVERLKQFPADFKLALHHRAHADEAGHDPARLSPAEMTAEVAYLNWLLHSPDRARLERDEPERVAEIGRHLAGLVEEAAFRRSAENALSPGSGAAPAPQP